MKKRKKDVIESNSENDDDDDDDYNDDGDDDYNDNDEEYIVENQQKHKQQPRQNTKKGERNIKSKIEKTEVDENTDDDAVIFNNTSLEKGEGNAPKKATAPVKTSSSSAVANLSSLPLTLSKSKSFSTVLLQLDEPSLSLADDSGIIGRVQSKKEKETQASILFDLKGRLYDTLHQPTCSLAIVQLFPTEARLESVIDSVLVLRHMDTEFETVEGEIDMLEDADGMGIVVSDAEETTTSNKKSRKRKNDDDDENDDGRKTKKKKKSKSSKVSRKSKRSSSKSTSKKRK